MFIRIIPKSALLDIQPQRLKRMHVFHIGSIVLVPWFSCLGGYLSVPDDYPLVLGCDEHVSSSCLRSLVVTALER